MLSPVAVYGFCVFSIVLFGVFILGTGRKGGYGIILIMYAAMALVGLAIYFKI